MQLMRVAATHPAMQKIKGGSNTPGAYTGNQVDLQLEKTSTNENQQSVVQTTAEIVMVGKGPHPTCYLECKVAGGHPYL